jgi:transposase
MLDPYVEYLRRRVAEGCENAQQLWREIRQAGYPGSTRQVSKWMQNQRKKRHLGIPSEEGANPIMSLPSVRTCCYLMTAPPECLKPTDALLLEQLCQIEPLGNLYSLIQIFRKMIRGRQVALLDNWLDQCLQHGIAAIRRFAASLLKDYAAVRAALEYEWSNGQTEGQIHRLKLLKRQMYGRAKIDLLRLRVLYNP